jgi:hypothetical protein
MPTFLQTGSGVDQASYKASGLLRTVYDSDNSPPTVTVNVTMTAEYRHECEAAVQFKIIRKQTLDDVGWSAPSSGRFISGKNPEPNLQEAGGLSRADKFPSHLESISRSSSF